MNADPCHVRDLLLQYLKTIYALTFMLNSISHILCSLDIILILVTNTDLAFLKT